MRNVEVRKAYFFVACFGFAAYVRDNKVKAAYV